MSVKTKNRGAHGVSSSMLGTLVSSSENPLSLDMGSVKRNGSESTHKGELFDFFRGEVLGCVSVTTGWPIADESWRSADVYLEQKRRGKEEYIAKCGPCIIRQMTEDERVKYG